MASSEPVSTEPATRATGGLVRAVLRAVGFLAFVLLADRCVGFVLLRGLERYYGMDRPAQVLCVGHSRTVLGIDDARLERELGVPVAKYAVNGADAADRLAMVRHFLLNHPSVRVLVYDVSAYTFSDRGLSSNSYKLFYPHIADPSIREHVTRCAASMQEVFWRRLFMTLRFDEVTAALAVRGYTGMRGNLKVGSVDVAAVREQVRRGAARRMEIDPENVELLAETLRFARSGGVRVLLVYIPTLDVLSDADRATHDAVIARIRALAAAESGVSFVDYNRDLESRHELFFDPIHMNGAGQAVVTQRLAHDLAEVLRSPSPSSEHVNLAGAATGR